VHCDGVGVWLDVPYRSGYRFRIGPWLLISSQRRIGDKASRTSALLSWLDTPTDASSRGRHMTRQTAALVGSINL
jgi:hypothetical protein